MSYIIYSAFGSLLAFLILLAREISRKKENIAIASIKSSRATNISCAINLRNQRTRIYPLFSKVLYRRSLQAIVVTAYIDDFIVFGTSLSNIALLRKRLEAKVEISDRGDIFYYLDIKITRNRPKQTLVLS